MINRDAPAVPDDRRVAWTSTTTESVDAFLRRLRSAQRMR
jgi:hypothetical protein